MLVHPSSEAAVSVVPPHLSPAQVAAYVDGTLAGDERARVEAHLVDCDACREEVTGCARLVSTAPAGIAPRGRWRIVVPVAAVLLAAVVLRRPDAGERVAPTLERGAGSDGSRIVLVSPAAGHVLPREELRFVWRPIHESVGYRVVIKDSTGASVWSGDVADTSVVIPATLPLEPGASYLWRVDGQRADGSTASSAEVEFRAAR